MDIDDVEVQEGSLVIAAVCGVVAVTPVAPVVAPVVAGSMIAGVALWAADKFFGGALAKVGQAAADKLLQTFHGKDPRNAQRAADATAREIADQHGCRYASTSGGVLNGNRIRYVYALLDCNAHQLVVDVDPYGKEVPTYILAS
jgi:hypothetical protein